MGCPWRGGFLPFPCALRTVAGTPGWAVPGASTRGRAAPLSVQAAGAGEAARPPTFPKPQPGSTAGFLSSPWLPAALGKSPSPRVPQFPTGPEVGAWSREGSGGAGSSCPISQMEKPRLRAFTGCLKAGPQRGRRWGLQSSLLSPKKHGEMLAGATGWWVCGVPGRCPSGAARGSRGPSPSAAHAPVRAGMPARHALQTAPRTAAPISHSHAGGRDFAFLQTRMILSVSYFLNVAELRAFELRRWAACEAGRLSGGLDARGGVPRFSRFFPGC